jgi:hypothetical protein
MKAPQTPRPADVEQEMTHGELPLCVRQYIRSLEHQLQHAESNHQHEVMKNRSLRERLCALAGRYA